MRFLFLIPCLVLSIAAMGQENKTETSAKSSSGKSVFEDFSASFGVSGRTDFKETEDNSKNYSSIFSSGISYKVDSNDTISFSTAVSKDLSTNYKENLLDSSIAHTHAGFYSYKNITLSLKTAATIPTSERSIKSERLTTALGVSLITSFNLEAYVPKMSFTYIPTYRRSFHRFETNRSGANLIEQSLVNVFAAGYSFSDELSFGSTLIFVTTKGYNGRENNNAYVTSQNISYSLNKTSTLSVGIETGGLLRELERGSNKTIQIFDKNSTEFYTGLSLVF